MNQQDKQESNLSEKAKKEILQGIEVGGEELIQREWIEDTPFQAVKKGTDEWIVTLGKYRIGYEQFKELEELKKFVNDKPWVLIANVIGTIVYNELNKK